MRWAGTLLLLLLAGDAAAAQTADPLVAVGDADPLELGRVVERLGDGEVLARLDPARPVVVRLAAIRATPWLRAPEAALAPLAEIAGGRDSYLAPAAILATLRIARALEPADLAAREVLPGELAPVRARLDALAADATARADVRRAAAVAAAELGGLLAD